MSPAGAEPRRAARAPLSDDAWKRLLVLFIAATAFLSAVIGLLEVDAGARAAIYNREARAAGMRAVAKNSAAVVRVVYERERLAAYQALATEWLIENAAASAASSASAAELHVDSVRRLATLMDATRSTSTLLSPPYFDEDTYFADTIQFNVDYVVVPATLASEVDAARQLQGSSWNGKRELHAVCLTVIAVALFLFGLASTLRGPLRRSFAVVGMTLSTALAVLVLATAARPSPKMVDAALKSYADAVGDLTYAAYVGPLGQSETAAARAVKAIEGTTAAIDAWPEYAAAFELRGQARLIAAEESALAQSGEWPAAAFAAAAADFGRAIALGRDSGSLEDLLAWALFCAGSAEEAVAASQRALALSPEQRLRFGLRLALIRLGSGDSEGALREVEAALLYAEEHPLGSNAVTLREAVRALRRLAPLGWSGRETIERRVKEGAVSLIHHGKATPQPLTARLSAPVFADADGKARITFPSDTHAVRMHIGATDLATGASLVGVVTRDGIEQPALGWSETWTGSATGSIDRLIGAPSGLTIFHLAHGEYQVEVYVDGALANVGTFRVE